MKIVNRKEFLELEEPILFLKCDGSGNPTSNLQVSLGRCSEESIDFVSLDFHLHVKKWCDSRSVDDCEESYKITKDAINNKTSFEYDYSMSGRDGLYDENQMFIVYEKMDMLKLMRELNNIYHCKYNKDDYGEYCV